MKFAWESFAYTSTQFHANQGQKEIFVIINCQGNLYRSLEKLSRAYIHFFNLLKYNYSR